MATRDNSASRRIGAAEECDRVKQPASLSSSSVTSPVPSSSSAASSSSTSLNKQIVSAPSSKTMVFVASSTIAGAGRGVFAQHDLPANTSVCYYDGYARPAAADKKLTDIERSYLIGEGSDAIVGYICPRTTDGVAQLINDVARPDFSRALDATSLRTQTRAVFRALLDYVNTLPLCNVVSTSDSPLTFSTTRAVAAGEELFYHYGVHYWYEAIKNPITLVRAAIVAYTDYKSAAHAVQQSSFMTPKDSCRSTVVVGDDTVAETLHRLQSFVEPVAVLHASMQCPTSIAALERNGLVPSLDSVQCNANKGVRVRHVVEWSRSERDRINDTLVRAWPLFEKEWQSMEKRFAAPRPPASTTVSPPSPSFCSSSSSSASASKPLLLSPSPSSAPTSSSSSV